MQQLSSPFYSEMRLSEVLHVKIKNNNFVPDDAKNGDRKIIPIHHKLNQYLHHVPIQPAKSTVQKWFRLANRACGHTDLHFHDLRHSAAIEMIKPEVDLYTVGGVLGHKSVQSTKRYSHLTTKTLVNAVAKIGRHK